MKVKDLLAILKSEVDGDPSVLENEFVVAIKYKGDQYTHDHVEVKDVCSGIDFENGKTIVYPKELLNIDNKKKK